MLKLNRNRIVNNNRDDDRQASTGGSSSGATRHKVTLGAPPSTKNRVLPQVTPPKPVNLYPMQPTRPTPATAPEPERDDFSMGQFGKGILQKGVYQAAKAGSSALSFLEGLVTKPIDSIMTGGQSQPLTESGLFHKWNQSIDEGMAKIEEENAANLQAGGKLAQVADSLGTATIAAIPQAIAAFATGGGSLGEQGLRVASAAPGVAASIRSAAASTAKNPTFWTSYFTTIGNEYEDAIADGASEVEATIRAVASGAANAAVEVGGGIETLPNELKGADRFTIKKWVETMLDEGKEEVAQGIISRASADIFHNAGNPLYSTTDPDAVLNPWTAAQEFGGGAFVGGLLGGAEGLASNAFNRYNASKITPEMDPAPVDQPVVRQNDPLIDERAEPDGEEILQQMAQEMAEQEPPAPVTDQENQPPAKSRAEQPADEMTTEDAMAAFNGGGRFDVINHQAVEDAVRDGTVPLEVDEYMEKRGAEIAQQNATAQQQETPTFEEPQRAVGPEPTVDFSTMTEDEALDYAMRHSTIPPEVERILDQGQTEEYTKPKKPTPAPAPQVDPVQSQSIVEQFSQRLGRAGQSTMELMYKSHPDMDMMEANGWVRGMTGYYNAGMEGIDIKDVPRAIGDVSNFLTEPESQAAYLAGQADANAVVPVQQQEETPAEPEEEFLDWDPKEVREELARREETGESPVDAMLEAANKRYAEERPTTESEKIAQQEEPENKKEATNDGKRVEERPVDADRADAGAMEEVPDDAAVREPGPGRSSSGEALDQRVPGDVPEDEGSREPDADAGGRGGEPGGDDGRPDSGRDTDRRSEGDRKREDVPAEPERPVTEEPEEAPAEKTTEEEIQQKEDLAVQVEPRGENFNIEQAKVKIPNTPKSRFAANRAAIKTLRTIIAEDRLATPDEQAILSKYTGWGGLSEAFDERKTEWAKEYKQLRDLLSDDEYKAARSTILDAYYTEPSIIQAMYNGLEKIGFKGGRLLEPSAGVGRFIGAVPASMRESVKSWTAVELDPITGNIAKYLYPNADVRVQGYQDAKLPDAYMDLAIGNVPFGSVSIADRAYPKAVTRSIHNYFIAKTLDKVRPGGVVALITTSGTMDSNSPGARAYFAKHADLIGAIRLPNTAFKGTGTSVIADILVFKVREKGTPYAGEAFQESRSAYHGDVFGPMNEYFDNHPEMVLGTLKRTMDAHFNTKIDVLPADTRLSLEKQIEKAFSKITAKMDYPVRQTTEDIRAQIRKDAGKAKEGAIIKKDGKLYKNSGGQLVEASDIRGKNVEKMDKVISLRDTARKLLDLQVDGASDADIKAARAEANKIYDEFVKKNGPLHKTTNQRLIHKDADYPFIMSLEDYNKDTGEASKAAIFTKNTVEAAQTVTHADTVDEAITVIMNDTGVLDAKRVGELTGKTTEEVRREMLDRELAYLDRNGNLQTAEQYLSGNVRAKLKDAEALAEGNPDYKRNVEALKRIIPADIAPEDINVRLGATWVPDSVYSAFASKMLGGRETGTEYMKPSVSVKYQPTVGKFFIEVNDSWMRNRTENTSTWGTEDYPFVGGRNNILDAALNNKAVTVYRTVGETRVVDKQATAAAQEKLNKVLAEFRSWLWEDGGRRDTLAPLYNDMFNNTVTPNYNGDHLTVAGSNPAMPMRPHQRNAVQRIINSGGNTLLAHRVGAGKTYEMAAAAMKLRQLGIVKKPLFTVPKHLVAQWGNEFLSYFPAAKILVLEEKDFTKAKRQTFANRIATGDYDAVIMSYEQFSMVPMSKGNQEAFYKSQLDALEEAISESKSQSGRDPSVREMERRKKNLKERLKKLGDSKKDEDNIDFEQLGIDSLFVDEAHNFKNLYYITKMNNVSDLGDKEGSQRAFDLYMKVRYLQKLNGGRGIVFATATPVMNSVVELYTMQRYLQGDLLEARGLTNFDAWANQFGEINTIRKMKPGGNGYELKQSLSKYKNMAELQQMFRAFSDVIVDPEDLPYLKIPNMKGGKRIVVESEPSAFQESFMEELGKRAEKLRGAGKGGDEDHIFKIMADGKKISYTQRMIDPKLPYEDGGKVAKLVENVSRIWKESKKNKGTQLIFCDRGTPGGAEAANGVSLYEDVKNLLVGTGIPADEIAFIHDASTDEAKAKLFKDVNEGKVRILIGSTAKMGTGMNVQRRITAIHELNAPDRPGDLEQNEGRGLRQGNMNDEVEVYTYVTKKTFDSRQWDNLKRKATFIHQVMAGEYTGREAEGDGDLALSAAEISAIASDNPLIMEQFEVSEKVANLEALEREHIKERHYAEFRLERSKKALERDKDTLAKAKKDLATKKDTSGDNFKVSVNGKVLTERKAAGNAIIAATKKHLDLGSGETLYEIGDFAGFKLFVTSSGYMVLRGELSYRGEVNMEDGVATAMRLHNTAENAGYMIHDTEIRIKEYTADIPKLEKIISSPFDRASELKAARARENEIIEALNPKVEQDAPGGEESSDSDVQHDVLGDEDVKAERWKAKRTGATDKKVKPLSKIIEGIRHDFGLNITTGHIRGPKEIAGQYNKKDQGIRVRIANDLPTVSHELGHHLAQKYDLTNHLSKELREEIHSALGNARNSYDRSRWTSEGLAEYVRKFLQNRETAAIDYPTFTEYFLSAMSAQDLALIEQLADDVNAYYSMDADTAASSIRLREEKAPDARTYREKIRDKMSVIYQAFTDSNEGIRRFDEATDANTYKLASNAAYSDAIAGQIIVGDLTDANGQYVGPGLKTVLHGIDLNNKKEYREFGEYLVVKHGPERLAEGMRVFADDRKNSSIWMYERTRQLEDQHPEFKAASERLYEFQQQFLRTWGVNTGLVGKGMADQWAERWKFYVPFNRMVEDKKRGIGAKRGFANQNSTIKRAHGSGRDIIHPVDNIVDNMVKMVNAGVRNNVMRKITEAADQMDAEAIFIEKVPTPLVRNAFDMSGVKSDLADKFFESGLSADDKHMADMIVKGMDDILYQYSRGKAHGDVVTVMRGGEPEFWKINDPQLLESVTNMSQKTMDGILDAYAVVSRFMTSNITGNNIIWSIFSNAPRDLMTFFTYSKNKNPIKAFAGIGSAYLNKAKGENADPLYKEYLAMGGGKTSAYTADRDLAKKARAALAKKKINVNPLDWITFVSDAVELGPRYATYRMMRQSGMNPQEAFYEAMDITVNFRRGGRVSRQLNKVIPFFNASVQGLDKFQRWITAQDIPNGDRKKVARHRMFCYLAVSAALAALVYGYNNRDDDSEEDYEQLSNFTKNSFWSFGLGDGKFFTIPKPRELAVLSSFFETCMEQHLGGNDHAFDEFYDYAVDNFAPSVISDVAKGDFYGAIGSLGIVGTGAYMMANRDFLGKPIVGPGLQNLEAKDQYTERTSKIAYWMGQAFNMSPQKIDFFFSAVLGGWWKYQKALLPVGGENVDLTLGVQNSYVKDNQYSTDLVNWLFDRAEKSGRAKSSDPGNIEKAITGKMDENMTRFFSNYNKVAKNRGDSPLNRQARQTVLDAILEYQKTSEHGTEPREVKALYDVCRSQKTTDALPSVMQNVVKDGNEAQHILSPMQYVEYQTDYLRLFYEGIEDTFTTGQTAAERLALAKSAKDVAAAKARDRVLSRIGAPKTDYFDRYPDIQTDDLTEYLAQRDIANDDGSLKQDEVIDILEDMVDNGLSKGDAYTLFKSQYKSDKNNPWKRWK